MGRYTLAQMTKLPHLADLIMPADGEFFPEKLITHLGLYEAALIDAARIQVYEYPYADSVPRLEVSRDIKALHKFMNFNGCIMLPCPECRQNQPFDLRGYYNPREVKLSTAKPKIVTGTGNRVPVECTASYIPVDDRASEKHNIFNPPNVPKYRMGQDYLRDFDRTQFEGVDFSDYEYQCAMACVDGIASKLTEIRRDFICTYNNQHRGFVDFILFEAVDRYTEPEILRRYRERQKNDPAAQMTKDEAFAAEAYNQLSTCLIIEKVGQYPSMADQQMFDIEKYRTVLSGEHFRDFKTAIGLYASGVGCGSFVYLRRIFEGLVIEAEQTASQKTEWDAGAFTRKDFNQKIDYLEAFGHKLIPDELAPVKGKIYGVLSRGVHASSDQECKELFPIMKYVIEELLDLKIQRREHEQKLQNIRSVLGKA